MKLLDGKRILVVEDEALIAAMLEDMLHELGATVVGPALTIKSAIALARADEIDAAVLDVNIRSERVDPVADILRNWRIPVVFASGYGASAVRGKRGSRDREALYFGKISPSAYVRTSCFGEARRHAVSLARTALSSPTRARTIPV